MRILFYLVLVVLSTKCFAQETIKVNIDENNNLLLSEISKKSEIVDISFKEVPGHINRVFKAGNNFVIEEGPEPQFYVYDEEGIFLKQLSLESFGKDHFGKDLILRHADISIDHNNKLIYASYGEYLLKYDFDGNYVSYSKSAVNSLNIPLPLKKGMANVVIYPEESYGNTSQFPKVVVTTKTGIESYVDNHITTVVAFNGLCDLNDYYTLHFCRTDTVYSIDKRNGFTQVKYVFDFGDKSYVPAFVKMTFNEQSDYIENNPQQAGAIMNYHETAKYIIADFYHNSQLQTLLYDKKDKTCSIVNLIDDMYDSTSIKIVGATSKSLIFVLHDKLGNRHILELFM